jgi:hypothetical protein
MSEPKWEECQPPETVIPWKNRSGNSFKSPQSPFTKGGLEGIFPANAGFVGEETGNEKFQRTRMNYTKGS